MEPEPRGPWEELALALVHQFTLTPGLTDGTKALLIVDSTTGKAWEFPYSSAQVARFIEGLHDSGVEAGVGSHDPQTGCSPGAALLSIHIEEAIATAPSYAKRLVVGEGGVVAV